MEPLLKPEQAADRLGCSVEQLWAWVDAGRLTCFRIGNGRFDPRDLSVEPEAADEFEAIEEPLEEVVSIDLLERVVREAGISRRSSIVYVVEAGEDGPVKIGFCGQLTRLRRRLAGIQTGCPAQLRVLWLIQGGLDLERRLHQDLAVDRIRGEWFDREALEHLVALTAGHKAWSRELDLSYEATARTYQAPGYAGGLA